MNYGFNRARKARRERDIYEVQTVDSLAGPGRSFGPGGVGAPLTQVP